MTRTMKLPVTMKRICLLALLVVLNAQAICLADSRKSVKLDDISNVQAVVDVSPCLIHLELVDVKESGDVKIAVSLENNDESCVVCLFDRTYSEKELSRLRPKISFDKTYPGSKGWRTVEGFKGISSSSKLQCHEVEPLLVLSSKDGESRSFRVPVYISTFKAKKVSPKHIRQISFKDKFILQRLLVIEIEVYVELKPDACYLRMHAGYENLKMELEKSFFCTNEKHSPSWRIQESIFQERIDSLMHQVDSVVEYHGWFSQDRKYKLYDGLRQEISTLDVKSRERDCGQHVVVHKCAWCSYSLQQISHKMDDIFQQIYSSSERAKEKAACMRNVRAMYKCAQQREEWKRGGAYRAKIVRMYNEINNL